MLERQDLSRKFLAHHELQRIIIIIVIITIIITVIIGIIIIIIIAIIITIIIIIINSICIQGSPQKLNQPCC